MGPFIADYTLWVMLIVEGPINVSFYVISGRVVSLVIITHLFIFILRNQANISQQILSWRYQYFQSTQLCISDHYHETFSYAENKPS